MGKEAELLGRLRGRDETAFVELVDTYRTCLVRFARTFVSSGAAAEDVAQDTWVAVIRGLEGRLSRRDRKRFERHLAGCPNCSTYLEQIRQTIKATGEIAPESLAPGVRDELMDLFRKYSANPQEPE